MGKGKESESEPGKNTAAMVSLISGGIAGGVEGELLCPVQRSRPRASPPFLHTIILRQSSSR